MVKHAGYGSGCIRRDSWNCQPTATSFRAIRYWAPGKRLQRKAARGLEPPMQVLFWFGNRCLDPFGMDGISEVHTDTVQGSVPISKHSTNLFKFRNFIASSEQIVLPAGIHVQF